MLPWNKHGFSFFVSFTTPKIEKLNFLTRRIDMKVYALFTEDWGNSEYGGYDVHTSLYGVYRTLSSAMRAMDEAKKKHKPLNCFIKEKEVKD